MSLLIRVTLLGWRARYHAWAEDRHREALERIEHEAAQVRLAVDARGRQVVRP